MRRASICVASSMFLRLVVIPLNSVVFYSILTFSRKDGELYARLHSEDFLVALQQLTCVQEPMLREAKMTERVEINGLRSFERKACK